MATVSLENQTVRLKNIQCFITLNVKTNFRRKVIFTENMKKGNTEVTCALIKEK